MNVIYATVSPQNSDKEEKLAFATLPQVGHSLSLYTNGRKVVTTIVGIHHEQPFTRSRICDISITTGPWLYCDN